MQIEQLHQIYLQSTGVTTDTRNIQQGNIFFALKGDRFNANTFAEEALNKGAGYVVVDEITNPEWKSKYANNLIFEADVLTALQNLAAHHRKQLKCPVLAITGSNGKTTTKELIAAVVSKKFKTQATKGNLNNHIGVPLTILAMPLNTEFAIIEMGANHIGEIASYCKYAAPLFGLITNVGMAHTEGFGGFDGVVKGKTELYHYINNNSGKIFVSADNEILLGKIAGLRKSSDIINYGTARGAFCHGELVKGNDFLTVATEGIKISSSLVGDYNFENVMSAICVGKYFGVDLGLIKEAIEDYVPSNNRSQKITRGTTTIILDAYNANPSSMTEALKNFDKISAPNKVAILGEMMELGAYAKTEHEKIKLAVSNMQLAKKIFVGDGFRFLRDEAGFTWFENTEQLKQWFKEQNWDNTYLLIKGSRKNGLEKILEQA